MADPIRFSPDNAESFVQLPVECPECGKREARRVAKWRLALYRNENPERVAEHVTCGRCGHQFGIKVRAYQEAAA